MHRLLHTLLCLLMISAVAVPPMQAKDYVVVIDPGHGGKDAGAQGARINEKTVNLKVARKLQKMLQDEMDDVKVVMTRDDDRFIPLQRRADIANGKHADIFISIHANSISKKSPMHKRINGAAVYTLGLDKSDTNLSVAMRENEVMKMEDDYTSTYQGFDPSSTESYIAFEMMQHKNMDQSIALAEAVQNQLVRHAGRKNNGVRQAPFWVLVRTSMPAILVELDYICNPSMETFMSSDAGSTKLARAIYNGVERYRTSSSTRATTKGNPKPHPASKARPEPEETAPDDILVTKTETKGGKNQAIVYKIQFLTAPKAIRKGDARFKKLSPVDSYKDGGMIKYTYGAYSSMAEANRELKKVKKKFPDAFVIKTRNGKRVK